MVIAHLHLKFGGDFTIAYGDDREIAFDNPRSATFLRVTSAAKFVSFSRKAWLRFVELFGDDNAPHLRTICIVKRIAGQTEPDFCIGTLMQIITTVAGDDPYKIQDFTVMCTNFTGIAGDDDGWERLREVCQSKLRGLTCLNYVRDVVGDDDEIEELQRTLQTLMSLASLEEIDVRMPWRQEFDMLPPMLSGLSNCTSLRTLSLPGCVLADDQILALAKAIRCTRELNYFDVLLSRDLASPGDCGRELSSALQHLPFGLSLELRSSGTSMQDEFLIAFAAVLNSRLESCVESLAFYFEPSDNVLATYRGVVSENYTLTDFFCFKDGVVLKTDLYEEIQFLLALNVAGRATIARQGTLSSWQWVDLLANANEGLDESFFEEPDKFVTSALFHFLSLNPQLMYDERH